MKKHLKNLSLILLTVFIVACAYQTKPNESLYARLGGKEGVTVIVDETINQVANDPKSKRSFEGIKLKALKEGVVEQLCFLTGGGCEYTGQSMKKSHADAKITSTEFELMVSALRESLNRHVGEREKNELLKILAPMKHDIVYSGS